MTVIRWFGTSTYKDLLDIRFKTNSDDSDNDNTSLANDEIEPPYPSYYFDQFLK